MISLSNQVVLISGVLYSAYVRGLRNVGPGSYDPVASISKPRSSLDGKKFCNVTMKIRPRVTVGAVSPHEEAMKPGPGTYTLPDEIAHGHHCPKIGERLREVFDVTQPNMYDISPGLGDKPGQCKSTFGMARRWETEKSIKKSSQSPCGDLYYSHSKPTNDYSKVAKSNSLSGGDHPILLMTSTTEAVGPGTYDEGGLYSWRLSWTTFFHTSIMSISVL